MGKHSFLTTCLLAQALSSSFGLFKRDDIYQRFTWVSLTASPWLLPAWSLLAQVQIRIRSCPAFSARGFVVLAASDRFVANAACASRELMAVHQVTSPPCDCHSYPRNFVSHLPHIAGQIMYAFRCRAIWVHPYGRSLANVALKCVALERIKPACIRILALGQTTRSGLPFGLSE